VKRNLNEVIGKRGENIVELCLTDYTYFPSPLFSPTHLGDKWPAVDFYVEVTTIADRRPSFFVQAKATTRNLRSSVHISPTKDNIAQLLKIPAPTYILGIHEPSRRVFIRSVHLGIPNQAITRIPVDHELTATSQKSSREGRSYSLNSSCKILGRRLLPIGVLTRASISSSRFRTEMAARTSAPWR